MSNPFDDLEALDDDDDGKVGDTETTPDSLEDEAHSAEQGSAGAATTSRSSASSTETASTSPADDASNTDGAASSSAQVATETSGSADGPAFPYEEVKQRPLYAREDAWNAFEDALELDVERTLREYDVRDAAGRELHDAALRVAADHPEEIASQLLELRGIEANQ
jgi:hypothetical protein